ncbi:hypothetical protein M422DRAFT_267471 [Sphaerobolus stellatus SS14]|uniref:Uncharacterized protein n=1 Tax=Sphaerobolus stellatus (strain SS14) TaxID=990650 RepID=A0A0C9V0N7_SPHS4|nr:hypothetical protein M422DRAFT_267471 [Sphaerobolus stellatus SS14]
MSSNSNPISSVNGKDICKDELTKNLTDKDAMEEDDEIVVVGHQYQDGTPYITYTHAEEKIIPNNADVNVTSTRPPSHGGSVSQNAFNNYLTVPSSATSNANESVSRSTASSCTRWTRASSSVPSRDQQEHKATPLGHLCFASYPTTDTHSLLSTSRDAPSSCDICTRTAPKSNTKS